MPTAEEFLGIAPKQTAEEFLGLSSLQPPNGVQTAEEFLGLTKRPGMVRDTISRVGEGAATTTAGAVKGAARLADMVATQRPTIPIGMGFSLNDDNIKKLDAINARIQEENLQQRLGAKDRLGASTLYQIGQATEEAAREIYGQQQNPQRDDTLLAQVASGVGSTVPVLVTGLIPTVGLPAAASAYGLSAGEQGAQEAIDAGKPEAADIAFLADAGLGAATEGIVGAGARLLSIVKRARMAGVNPRSFGQTALRAAAEGSLREGGQEGLEQLGQNLVAADVAEYDPERPLMKDVGRSALVGATVGGLLGGAGGAAQARSPVESSKSEVQGSKLAEDLEVDIPVATESLSNELPGMAAEETGDRTQESGGGSSEFEVSGLESEAETETTAAQPEIRDEVEVVPTERSEVITPQEVPVPSDSAVTQGAAATVAPDEFTVVLEPEAQGRLLSAVRRFSERNVEQSLGPEVAQSPVGQLLAEALTVREDGRLPLRDRVNAGILAAKLLKQMPGRALKEDVEGGQMSFNRSAVDTASIAQERPSAVSSSEFQVSSSEGARPSPARSQLEVALGRVENWAQGAKIDTRGKVFDAVQGIPVAVYNGALEAVRLAAKGGRKLNEAVQAGVEWLKANYEGNFDEALVRASLLERLGNAAVAENEQERAFAEQVRLDPRVGEAVKAQRAATQYVPRSNDADAEAAQIIAQRGLENAVRIVKGLEAVPGISGTPIEVALGFIAARRFAQMEGEARAAGDKAAEQAAIEAQVDLYDTLAVRGTEGGQYIQAFRMFSQLTPAGMLKFARRTIERAQDNRLEGMRKGLEKVRVRLGKINKNGIEKTTQDAQVQEAARKAVNGAVQEQAKRPNTRLQTEIRDTVVDRLVQDGMVPPEARQIVKNFYGPKSAGGTLQDALNRGGVKADAKRIQSAYTARTEAERQKLPLRLYKARRAPEGKLDDIDKLVRQEVRRQRLKLGQLVRQHYTVVEGAERAVSAQLLADKLQREGGLNGEEARKFADTVKRRFDSITEAAKLKVLKQMETPLVMRKTVKPGFADKLIEVSNLGAFSKQQFYEAVAERLDLPRWTPEFAAKVKAKADEIQRIPEDQQARRQKATVELLNIIGKERGLKLWEVVQAVWYANILSAPPTHLVNALGNTSELAAGMSAAAVVNPKRIPMMLKALGVGAEKGVRDAIDILKTGIATGTRLQGKVGESRPLELVDFTELTGPVLGRALNGLKYVARTLNATDMLFYKSAEEVRAANVARALAKQEGLTGEALRRRVAEIMGYGPMAYENAAIQAAVEGYGGTEQRRRAYEILELQRPEELKQDALQWALERTFNSEPYGVMGAFAKGLNTAARIAPVINLVVPFRNVVSNVTNVGLDYFPPSGFGRALWGSWSGKLHGHPITSRDLLYEQYAKATLGTLLLTSLMALAADNVDEEDPVFWIHGSGPRSPEQKKQWRDSGAMPWSIKVGDRYYSYATIPGASYMLGVAGEYLDARRYKNLDQTEALNRAAYAMSRGGKVLVEQSFLDGLAGLFQRVGQDNTKSVGEQTGRQIARTATGFVVPNALTWLDKVFDPKLYQSDTVLGNLVLGVPLARREGRPAVNIFGEAIEVPTLSRFTTEQKADPLVRYLTANQLWISVPDKYRMYKGFNGPLTPEQYYEYVRLSGQGIRKRLETCLPKLQGMPPERARKFIDAVTEAERERARATIRKDAMRARF